MPGFGGAAPTPEGSRIKDQSMQQAKRKAALASTARILFGHLSVLGLLPSVAISPEKVILG